MCRAESLSRRRTTNHAGACVRQPRSITPGDAAVRDLRPIDLVEATLDDLAAQSAIEIDGAGVVVEHPEIGIPLAASGNPSILMVLWAPVVQTTPLGDELRALAPAFIGRHVIPRYRGYMESQGMRMLGLKGNGHGRRGGGGREELIDEYGYDTKYAMHAARLGYQCLELLTTGKLDLPIQGDPAVWLRAVRYGEVDFDEWWHRCLELDAALESLETDEDLPPGPDVERVEAWSADAHLRAWH